MSIEKRVTKLEGRSIAKPCPACDPGKQSVVIIYGPDDPDPRTPPGEQENPELQECGECGRKYRVFGRVVYRLPDNGRDPDLRARNRQDDPTPSKKS